MFEIYKAIVPFVMLQALGLVCVMVFSLIATWLTNLLITYNHRVQWKTSRSTVSVLAKAGILG